MKNKITFKVIKFFILSVLAYLFLNIKNQNKISKIDDSIEVIEYMENESPKKNKNPLDKIYSKANELKMIIYNLDDLKFAEIESRKVSNNCLLYLQPEWSKRDKIMPIIVDYVMKNPKWKVSLQTHKYLNIP